MLQKQGFLKEGTPQLTSNHQSTKIGHPSCENTNEAPDWDSEIFWISSEQIWNSMIIITLVTLRIIYGHFQMGMLVM